MKIYSGPIKDPDEIIDESKVKGFVASSLSIWCLSITPVCPCNGSFELCFTLPLAAIPSCKSPSM